MKIVANGYDRLDQLVFAQVGAVNGLVEAVLALNPGLADLGVIPPLDTVIELPEGQTGQAREAIRLWD